MIRNDKDSLGARLVERSKRATRIKGRSLQCGARNLPKIRGVNQQARFSRPQENVLLDVGGILADSGRVFRYGNSIVMEQGRGADGQLRPIAIDGVLEKTATGRLANVFLCEEINIAKEDSPPIEFPPPPKLLELALTSEIALPQLPEIELYSKRPCFDGDFNYRDGGVDGWHPNIGYLIHGPSIEPILPQNPSTNLADNIPPALRRLLQTFSFKSEIDLINVVGVMITGMLAGRFISCGKALVSLDGNQPGVGKTLLARTIGMVLDGTEPDLIRFDSDDSELEKRICASLRSKQSSLILLDNAKMVMDNVVSSVVVESQSVAPSVSLRILGTSQVYSRPNDLLWFLTMNDTRLSQDLISRTIAIQFEVEGDPASRDFGGFDPIDYARENRNRILGEIAGLVEYWTLQGRPRADVKHRLTEWAGVVGGILNSAGLSGFLSNFNEINSAFNVELREVEALFEAALRSTHVDRLVHTADSNADADGGNLGLEANQLVELFCAANVLAGELDSGKTLKAKSTRIGQFLKKHVNRKIAFEHDSGNGLAILRRRDGRANKKFYYFEVEFIDNEPTDQGIDFSSNDQPSPLPTGFDPPSENPSPATSPGSQLSPDPDPADSAGNSEEW